MAASKEEKKKNITVIRDMICFAYCILIIPVQLGTCESCLSYMRDEKFF